MILTMSEITRILEGLYKINDTELADKIADLLPADRAENTSPETKIIELKIIP